MSGFQEWETPPELFNELNRRFRFTVDAAASSTNRKCERYLTEEEDALHADIFDQVVWCNPPYADLAPWAGAFAMWSLSGSTVVALLPTGTGAEWFKLVWHFAHEIWLLSGRVPFLDATGHPCRSNRGDSMIAVFYPQPPRVRGVYEKGMDLRVKGGHMNPPRVLLWDWRRDCYPQPPPRPPKPRQPALL